VAQRTRALRAIPDQAYSQLAIGLARRTNRISKGPSDRVFGALLCAAVIAVLVGCEGATQTVDARFSTPEHTVRTLMSSYGLEDATQEQIRERMAAHDRFEIQSRATFRECFEDLGPTSGTHGAASEGAAGFVFGALAAGRDDVEITMTGDRATLVPRQGVQIVMHRGEDGAYRIVLAESVPAEVRARMASLAQHADDRLRRGIPAGVPPEAADTIVSGRLSPTTPAVITE